MRKRQPISQELGSNIRARRKELRLTLRSLAEKVGLSASFLSQVEDGLARPSVASLKAISDGLNTTISRMVGENASPTGPVTRATAMRVVEDTENKTIIRFLAGEDENQMMEPMVFKLLRRADSAEPRVSNVRSAHQTLYQHFGQEFVHVLRGRIKVSIKGNRYILDKGDSIYFNSGLPHAFWNIDDGDSEVLSINTPPNF